MLLNPRGIADYSVALADLVGRAIDVGEFSVVLGGDCSIVLGCLLSLKRRGRYGLLFLDGHADFYQPEAEPALLTVAVNFVVDWFLHKTSGLRDEP